MRKLDKWLVLCKSCGERFVLDTPRAVLPEHHASRTTQRCPASGEIGSVLSRLYVAR